MAATYRSPALSIVLPSCRNPRNRRRPSNQVIRARSYRDEGRGKHKIVDENLQVLRERIEDVKNREKLERCLISKAGWNYAVSSSSCDYYKQQKKELEQFQLMQVVVFNVVGTVGFTVLTCTLCLCLTSIFIHLSM